MKQKYTITIAGTEMNVVTEESAEFVDEIVGVIDRKIREINTTCRRCSRNEAARFCKKLRRRADNRPQGICSRKKRLPYQTRGTTALRRRRNTRKNDTRRVGITAVFVKHLQNRADFTPENKKGGRTA